MPKYWVSRAPRDGSVLARNGASFLPPAPKVNPNDSFSSRMTQTCLIRGGLNVACGAAARAGAAAAGRAAVAPAPAANMIIAAATGSLRRRALCTVAPRGFAPMILSFCQWIALTERQDQGRARGAGRPGRIQAPVRRTRTR